MTRISWPRFLRSVRHAIHGLHHAFKSENNFRIHSLIAVIVVVALVVFKISRVESMIVALMIASMFILELVNTIVERYADLLEPRVHPYVHIIKDLMAASVIIAAITALVIGTMVFWWPVLSRLGFN